MKGKTNVYTSQLGVEKLHLTLVTNQSEHSDIINANVTVNDKVYIYKGSELVIDIFPGQNYSIVFENVEGYKTPETITYTAEQYNNRFVTATYQTEIVTIELQEDSDLLGAVFTVNNKEYIWNGTPIKCKVPLGQSYTIVFGDIPGYETPTSITRIASGLSYVPNIAYTKQLGVFIVDVEGGLNTVSSWSGGSNATGVALLTDEVSIIIAPRNWYTTNGSNYDGAWNGNKYSAWGGYEKTVTGIKTTTSESDAITDFAGSDNTDAIISQLIGTTDSYSQYYTGAPAAEYCRAYSNGCKKAGQWYLPAAGEYNQIVLNKTAIEEALTAISGELFSSPGYEWTSTKYNSYHAWACCWGDKYFDTVYFGNDGNNGHNGVRPITTLKNQSGQIIWFKIGDKIYTGIYNQTAQEWVNSSHNVDNMYIENNKLYTSSKAEVQNVTASTVLVSGATYEAGGASVIVNLKSQWANSTKSSISGYKCFQSSSNYNVNNGAAIMTITIKGLTEFTCYIRSYAESNYDYVMIGQLDQAITGSSSYSNTTLVKAHTRGKQQSGTALSNYTAVTYSGIDGGEHTITVVYRKDSSVNSGDDRGYLLIPDENLTINA